MRLVLRYEKSPERIAARSFELIDGALSAKLGHVQGMDRLVAKRLVHSTGQVGLASRLVFHRSPGLRAQEALSRGAPVLCDAPMVVQGLVRSEVAHRCPVHDEDVCEEARLRGVTRSMVVMERYREHLEGAVVAIGNAPTALFRLLEGFAEGWPRPAVIFAYPVGFVGAAESKRALMKGCDVSYATVPGRWGGSAMACAAVNAVLLAGL